MKKILSLALALTMLLALFGCAKEPVVPESSTPETPESSTPETPEISTPENSESNDSEDHAQGKTVACCMNYVNHPVHRIVQTGFMLKAEELGMKPLVSGLDEGSYLESIDKWNSDVAEFNVAGIMLSTGDDSCYEMMKGMKEMGVYVTVPHFEHEYIDTKDFIDKNIYSQDDEISRNVADFIVDALTEKGITSGDIGLSHNGPGGVTENPLTNGFFERLGELNTDFTVLNLVNEGALITEATDKVAKYINDNPDMVAAFGMTAGSAQSWSAAIEATDRTDIIVVGVDYTEPNLDGIEKGHITGLVCRPLYDEGAACAKALYDLLNGTVFNASEDTWFEELEAPIATKEDIPYYRDIWQKMYDYFGE